MNLYKRIRHSLANQVYPRLPRYRELQSRMFPVDLITHPLRLYPPSTFWHLIHNYSSTAFPTLPMIFTEDVERLGDRNIVERLCKYYAHCLSIRPCPEWMVAGMWDEILSIQFAELEPAIKAGDIDRSLARFLRSFQTAETDGMGQGSQIFKAAQNDEAVAVSINSMTIDRLAIAAVALGVLPHENPEQGRYGTNVNVPLSQLVSLIAAKLHHDVARKPQMGLFGATVREGCIDPKVPDDIYTSYRLRQLVKPESSVAEIGGGFGGVAEFSVNGGISDYTIYDLPQVGLLQGFFLCRSLSAHDVWFEGEQESNARVKIRPFFLFEAERHDVFLNRDSFPEMPAQTSMAYLSRIAKAGKPIRLLSINQEAGANAWSSGTNQTNVSQLAASSGLECISRHPYWLRKGYVEELYAMNGQ